ncbi:MAG: HD-GYP domain-containing protein, partial [Planctomycetota bacterium]
MTANPSPSARLVAALFATLKLMGMYERNHVAVTRAVEALAAAVHAAAENDGEVSVSLRGQRIQVQGRRIRAAEAGLMAVQYLAVELGRRRIESLHFSASVTLGQLTAFAAAFLDLDLDREDPPEDLRAALAIAKADRAIRAVEQQEEAYGRAPLSPVQDAALRAYLQGMRVFRTVLRGRHVFDRGKLRLTRRAVQTLVDRFLEDDSALLALTRIQRHDRYLFQHSLHVCVFSLALGARLGMSRKQLGDLGLAALFHDLGKTVPGGEGEDARETVRQHPVRGARLLLRLAGPHEGMLKATIAAYEHHAHYDGSGFPAIEHPQHLVSRIVAIADCFESLTSGRPFRPIPYTPHDAFQLMRAKAGLLFDPILLKLFVQAVGLYPVGSLVQLDPGEIGMVVRNAREEDEGKRPVIRI